MTGARRDQAGMDPETWQILHDRALAHAEQHRATHPMPVTSRAEMRRRMRAADPTSILDDPDPTDRKHTGSHTGPPPRVRSGPVTAWVNGAQVGTVTGLTVVDDLPHTADADAFSQLGKQVGVLFEQIAVGCRRALDAFATFLREAGWDVPETPAGRPDVARATEPLTAAARRRHGTAAICPRHGPTRGGTCWKCRR